ncbi:TonB-dependent receptor [Tenacibaculum jejuense]|nr:TonB-dependent receptor [Tenacibaculum jejuense]
MLLFISSSYFLFAQTEVKGLVFDEYLEPFPGATVKTSEGKTTSSNFDGEFVIKVKKFPVTITVSLVGYQTENIQVTSADDDLNVILKETLGLDQVVVSASRTPERVIESPVTIERIGANEIKNTPSVNFYESLGNLKGIDVLADSYNVKTINSNRGFANTLNVRFIQLVDGAETTVPILDYSFGNTFGLNELDVKNVEILPGAASALYGANAFNGILLMTSKNPFDDAGVSTYFKTGVTTQEDRGQSQFYDVGIRLAHKFSDTFAAKANFTYSAGEEWLANDKRNSTGQGGDIIEGTPDVNGLDYDGVNVYGDEISLPLTRIARIAGVTDPALLGAFEGINIARRGYAESELLLGDTDAKSLLFDAGLYFRPWKDDTEIILSSKFNLLDNYLHASNRYIQKGAFIKQYKLEVKGDNYFVRGYLSRNNAGQTWDSRLAGIALNDRWLNNQNYYGQFASEFFQLISPLNPNALPIEQAALEARSRVEANRLQPGTDAFRAAVTDITNTPVSEGGAKLVDNSGFLNVDANYNFADKVDFANIQVGGSYRKYFLDSGGEIYTDDNGEIAYRQFGIYTQLQKKLLDDRLKLTGTVRYDKSDNFDGNFSPRFSVSYAAGEKRDHNFRFAFQTGFRNPTTQDQYIGLQLGADRVFLGSVEENLGREVTEVTSRAFTNFTTTLSGEDAFSNSYTASSIERFAQTGNDSDLEKAELNFVTPEIVRSFELGYRGAVNLADNLFEFDIVGFYNLHTDFITTRDVFVPFYGTVNSTDVPAGAPANGIDAIRNQDILRYVIRTNTDSEIDTYGFSAGFNTKVFNGFDLGASYAFADFKSDGKDPEFKESFNTPKHKVKVQFGHSRLFKNFGFNINARWQDAFLYESFFIDAIVEERTVLDAQINYGIPALKSIFKVGGTNLGGKDYVSVPGTGTIGSQYYISWVINN